MKLALFLALAVSAVAQSGRTVVLSWTASPSLGVTGYNIHRAPGKCATPGTFARITATPVSGLTYSDTNLPIGIYCYYATATGGGLESAASVTTEATVPPLPPGGFTGTLALVIEFKDGKLVADSVTATLKGQGQ